MAEHAEHQSGRTVRNPLTWQAPSKIVAVHVSYRSRAMERGRLPLWPSYFLKPPSTVAADGDPVLRPPWCELLAFEGEGRARHRDEGEPRLPRRRVGARALGHGGQ